MSLVQTGDASHRHRGLFCCEGGCFVRFYYMMWGVVKPFLSERTKDKFVLLGDADELLEYFDSDQLDDQLLSDD